MKHLSKRYKMLKDFWAQFPFQCKHFIKSEVERFVHRFYAIHYAPIAESFSSRVPGSWTVYNDI